MKVRVTLLNIVVASLAMWALVDILQHPLPPGKVEPLDLLAQGLGFVISAMIVIVAGCFATTEILRGAWEVGKRLSKGAYTPRNTWCLAGVVLLEFLTFLVEIVICVLMLVPWLVSYAYNWCNEADRNSAGD